MKMMKISLNNIVYKGVPLIEYYQENIEHNGLVFIQHGYQSNKEYGTDYLALTLARKGFFVVSIDAYKHGERSEEPYTSKKEKEMLFESPIVIRRTAIDIMRLHTLRYKKRFPTFDIIGISMGAMIAYYISTKSKCIRKLVPVIGTPDFEWQSKHIIEASGFKVEEFLNEETRNYLRNMSPMNHVHKMSYEELAIFCGKEDKVVPMSPTLRFIEEYNPKNHNIKSYDVGHEVHRDMQLDIFQFMCK